MVAADLEVELANLAKLEARLKDRPEDARRLRAASRLLDVVVGAIETTLDELENETEDDG